MTRLTQIRPEFVTFAPDVLEPGVVYASMEYATLLHACCCGCGNKVVTPLAPGRWHLTFDGEAISLNYSIGNWSFPCQSHYWIERNEVVWGPRFSAAAIAFVRATERRDKRRDPLVPLPRGPATEAAGQKPWWRRLLRRLQK
jgi:hypothetical protein